jgi:hypothetical protein
MFSLFPPFIKNSHYSPPKEIFRKNYSQNSNKKLCPEKRARNDPNSPFKEKEKERGERRSQLGGQWKVPMVDDLWKVALLGGL